MRLLDPASTTSLLPPGGKWAVGVSGGADSIALLQLLHSRNDLLLHVVHLDHQTRGAESAADAEFVRDLAGTLGLPSTIRTRADVEAGVARELPTNLSARFRELRLALFREVVAAHELNGVALAHHADDVAETALQRLLRGSAVSGLAGIDRRVVLRGVTVVRPLLGLSREALRAYLNALGQPWREDASNASPRYERNRLRALLVKQPELATGLMELAATCRRLREWVRSAAPALPETFAVQCLQDLPDLLARESARRWLTDHGAPADELAPTALDRLIRLATDAGTPPRQHFPGGILVRRRRGQVSVIPVNGQVREFGCKPSGPC
jgi:tRNA(Ile)-lysidine synthase